MRKILTFFKKLGPGFITGASDDDPSGIATYSQTGALFGYSQLWTALFTTPLMTSVQEMCGRIGLVTGKGLAGVIKEHYSIPILYVSVFLLLLANTINIGADLGAMAASGQLVFNIPFPILLLSFTFITLFLEIFISYKLYSKFLKYLTLSLLSYVIVVFIVKQDFPKILSSTFIPTLSFSKDYLLNIVAILGTTISPYLYFWQASEEVEEEVKEGKLRVMGRGQPRVTTKDIKEMRIDTVIGMLFSNLIMFFIIATAASTLFVHNIKNIETATDAALALRPLAGDFAFILFALGIVGTGLLAVPILAGSASYALSESFGWREGLYRKFAKAHGFYAVIIIATVVGLVVNFIGIQPFSLLYYTAVLNGIVSPPLLLIILLIGNNKKIMGDRTNNKTLNILGFTTLSIMTIASLALIFSLWIK